MYKIFEKFSSQKLGKNFKFVGWKINIPNKRRGMKQNLQKTTLSQESVFHYTSIKISQIKYDIKFG